MSAQGFSQSTPAVTPAVSPPVTSRQGGQSQRQNQIGNAGVQEQNQSVPGSPLSSQDSSVCDPNAVNLPNRVAPAGNLAYYGQRHGDFAARYHACGLTPPTYYIAYGEKYVGRFTNETSSRLTPEGQAWLGRARINLQIAIENQLGQDPAAFDRLEKNNAAFTSFAYGTHADAYWDAGLGDLNLFDLSNIGLTPDVRDLMAKDGLIQVADIGTRLLSVWGTDGVDYLAGEGTTAELVDAAYEGYVVVGDGIDEVFGAGASQRLVEGAQDLGVEAGHLASGAYDVAADVVSEGVGQVDSVMGSGWTEHTVDSGREVASDGVDYVEEQYNDARDWAEEVWDGFSF